MRDIKKALLCCYECCCCCCGAVQQYYWENSTTLTFTVENIENRNSRNIPFFFFILSSPDLPILICAHMICIHRNVPQNALAKWLCDNVLRDTAVTGTTEHHTAAAVLLLFTGGGLTAVFSFVPCGCPPDHFDRHRTLRYQYWYTAPQHRESRVVCGVVYIDYIQQAHTTNDLQQVASCLHHHFFFAV